MRLIDGDALLDNIKRAIDPVDMVTTFTVGICICKVMDMPTIDAVHVVRCKDCKWRTGAAFWTPCQHMPTTDDWYCGFGERRDADES